MNYELSPAHMKGDTVLKKGQVKKVPVKEPTATSYLYVHMTCLDRGCAVMSLKIFAKTILN